ncbi:ribose-phosphate pyrophosphokinase 1 [Savitreella phatthalungensis]
MSSIEEQGLLVRKLKGDPEYGPSHPDTKAAIAKLLELKAAAAPVKEPKQSKPQLEKNAVAAGKKDGGGVGGGKDEPLLIGITAEKSLSTFSDWYSQVLVKSDMLEYYDVSGCYILKPWSYTIWERVQRWFDDEIKKLGVENASFPLFVSSRVLQKEKDHIEGFAPEVAWVTKAGKNDLEEPIAIRPTSETVMYPYYAKWIQSHRDLPVRLNQWNSVVRWEFKTPQPFLRTREFLWQEGHTAFLTKQEAEEEVLQILDLYYRVYTDLLAVPMIKGIKTDKERFAGGLYTSTIEGFIPTTGRGIQSATSHCLGQNFSRMFGISVENPAWSEIQRSGKSSGETDGSGDEKLFVWQNSWGLSTRCIGVMVMVHGDNKGLQLPPRVAHTQVVIVPCGITAKTTPEGKSKIMDGCHRILRLLKAANIRVKLDDRDTHTTGYKFADWELKGVPLRIEFGPKDADKSQVLVCTRHDGNKSTLPLADDTLAKDVTGVLNAVHDAMYAKAKAEYDDHVKQISEWEKFVPLLDEKNVLLVPFCKEEKCEDAIKDKSARQAVDGDDTPVDERAPSMGAKSLCIPLEQPESEQQVAQRDCIGGCGMKAKCWTLFGRSY